MELLPIYLPALSGLRRPGLARAQMQVEATGTLSEATPRSLTGDLALSGVDWEIETLTAPLREATARATLTSRTLEVHELSGGLHGIPIQMNGRLEGDLLRRQIDRMELSWSTSGRLEDVGSLLEAAVGGPEGRPGMSGTFRGSGTLRLREPLRGSVAQALGRAALVGEVQVNDALLEGGPLTAPIERLNGQVRLSSEGAAQGSTTTQTGAADGMQWELSDKPRDWQFRCAAGWRDRCCAGSPRGWIWRCRRRARLGG